ncbi:MAG: hypothetical protein E7224_06695, partial [Clostridiales bacterium]|nr:hypothetical protein [Clostridiales bacterium]
MKKLKIFFKIICIVGVVLLILGLVAAFGVQKENAKIEEAIGSGAETIRNMELQSEQCRIELAAGEEEILSLQEERDWLLNMDQNIADLKQEYAQNIRTLEDKILAGESDVKIAYLTFDDGPYKQTEQYLAILDQYDIKATFFVIGRPDRADYYRLIRDKGHTIANHTYSHGIRKGLYDSPQSFIGQVNKLEDLLYEET